MFDDPAGNICDGPAGRWSETLNVVACDISSNRP